MDSVSAYPDPIGNSTVSTNSDQVLEQWKLLLTLNYSFVSVLIILVGVKIETFNFPVFPPTSKNLRIPYPDPIGNSTEYWKLLLTLN